MTSETILSLLKIATLISAGFLIVKLLLKLIDKLIEKQVLKDLERERTSNSSMVVPFSPDGKYVCYIIPGRKNNPPHEKPERTYANQTELLIPEEISLKQVFVPYTVRRIVKYPDGKIVLEEEKKAIPLLPFFKQKIKK